MTIVNRVYITDELMRGFGSMNIQNIDLAHNPTYNTISMGYNAMYGSFHNNANIVSVSNISNGIYWMGGVDNPWDSGVFSNCINLVNAPDLSGCNNLTSEQYTFKNCISLVNAPTFPNSLTSMRGTYRNTNIVDAPNLPSSLMSMEGVFSDCYNLVNASPIPSSMTSMYYPFSWCQSLVNGPDMSNCTNLTHMSETFIGCQSLVNVSSLANCVNLTQMPWVFNGCSSLVNAPELPNSVINMCQSFAWCYNLVNAPDLSNCFNLTDMSRTFESCTNLVNAPAIPNSVTNMAQTFEFCYNLVNVPVISNLVSNMYCTFRQCSNLAGDITILSEEVKDALYCFQDTYANKTVIIPFNISHSETYVKGYYWETQSGKIIYTTTDFYSICISDPYGWHYDYNPKDENFGYLNGTIQYNPWGAEGEKYTINYEIEGTWYNETITYDSSKNVIITKSVGDSSFTYDSFIAAGYDTVNRVNGVILKDLNDKGTLMFDVTPIQDTAIYVDGVLLSGYGLETSSGEHSYTLSNPNYITYYGTTNVLKNNITTVTKDLTNITGYNITVNTNVEDCTVIIGDITATAVTSTQYTSLSMYSENERTIYVYVEKYGYVPYYNEVTFNNANIALNISLESLDVDLTNWSYTTDEFGNVILEDYIGPDVETLVIPKAKI